MLLHPAKHTSKHQVSFPGAARFSNFVSVSLEIVVYNTDRLCQAPISISPGGSLGADYQDIHYAYVDSMAAK